MAGTFLDSEPASKGGCSQPKNTKRERLPIRANAVSIPGLQKNLPIRRSSATPDGRARRLELGWPRKQFPQRERLEVFQRPPRSGHRCVSFREGFAEARSRLAAETGCPGAGRVAVRPSGCDPQKDLRALGPSSVSTVPDLARLVLRRSFSQFRCDDLVEVPVAPDHGAKIEQ